jgi:hypothetical protein
MNVVGGVLKYIATAGVNVAKATLRPLGGLVEDCGKLIGGQVVASALFRKGDCQPKSLKENLWLVSEYTLNARALNEKGLSEITGNLSLLRDNTKGGFWANLGKGASNLVLRPIFIPMNIGKAIFNLQTSDEKRVAKLVVSYCEKKIEEFKNINVAQKNEEKSKLLKTLQDQKKNFEIYTKHKFSSSKEEVMVQLKNDFDAFKEMYGKGIESLKPSQNVEVKEAEVKSEVKSEVKKVEEGVKGETIEKPKETSEQQSSKWIEQFEQREKKLHETPKTQCKPKMKPKEIIKKEEVFTLKKLEKNKTEEERIADKINKLQNAIIRLNSFEGGLDDDQKLIKENYEVRIKDLETSTDDLNIEREKLEEEIKISKKKELENKK